jgi:hypothetical protein
MAVQHETPQSIGILHALFPEKGKYCCPCRLSSTRVLGWKRGLFGPFIGPRRQDSERFGVSHEGGLRGMGRLRELNRRGGDSGWRSGHWGVCPEYV